MKVKNIMFSGVMAAILSATGASAAINVASQGYVDSKVGALETSVSNTYLTQEDAADTYATTEYVTENVTNVLGNDTEGLVADVKANADAIAANETEIAKKANAADVYTKTEADALLATKADVEDVYAKTETMTKTEINEAIGKIQSGGVDLVGYVKESTYNEGMALKADKTQVATDIATALNDAKAYADTAESDAVATAKAYSDSLAANYDAAGSAAAVEAKLADYTKTSDLNTTFATDEELGAVDAKFANYTTTEGLTTKLADYAKQVDLEAEVTARDTAVKAVDAKLADYTKTSDLDAGFVSESEMTTFKSENTAAINAKVSQSDYDTKVAALEAKDAELVADLAEKITMPEVCATTNCVLSTLGGTIQWVPLTEPLETTASN